MLKERSSAAAAAPAAPPSHASAVTPADLYKSVLKVPLLTPFFVCLCVVASPAEGYDTS